MYFYFEICNFTYPLYFRELKMLKCLTATDNLSLTGFIVRDFDNKSSDDIKIN